MNATPLSQDENDALKLYGCGLRCLVKLSTTNGNPTTLEEFVQSWRGRINRWKKHFGALATSEIIDIGREAGIFRNALTFRNQAIVRRLWDEGCSGIFVLTDFSFSSETGRLYENFHCRMLLGFSPDGEWSLWHPDQKNGDFPIQRGAEDLEAQQAHFIVFEG